MSRTKSCETAVSLESFYAKATKGILGPVFGGDSLTIGWPVIRSSEQGRRMG